jgi:glycosyltransferase involved in cell wall biosynthesis
MKISIVTISFNQKKYLRQCIESILSQADCDLEYIVVDPGSTDGSRALIESYGDRIIKVFEPDNGPADGLNQGFQQATGDVYGFINADDYLLPGALSQVSRYFESSGLRTFITGQGYSENASGLRSKIKVAPLTEQNMLFLSASLFQQATFFPAQAFQRVGGFCDTNQTCWDYELFLKLLKLPMQHEILAYDLAVFRLHPDSISGSGRLTDLYLQELDQIFLTHRGRPRNSSDRLRGYVLRLNKLFSRHMKL